MQMKLEGAPRSDGDAWSAPGPAVDNVICVMGLMREIAVPLLSARIKRS